MKMKPKNRKKKGQELIPDEKKKNKRCPVLRNRGMKKKKK